MKKLIFLSVIWVSTVFPTAFAFRIPQLNKETCENADETILQDIFKIYNEELQPFSTNSVEAEWNYNVDMTNPEKKTIADEKSIELNKFKNQKYEECFKHIPDKDYPKLLERQLKIVKQVGTAVLNNEELEELTEVMGKMSKIYSTAKICPFQKPKCEENEKIDLTPDIDNIFATSTNYEELLYTWDEWHKASGQQMLNEYKSYVNLMNTAAEKNNFADAGEMWRDLFEEEDLKSTAAGLWKEVEPLYDELHKYVRHKLRQRYKEMKREDKLIPAHVFGNMWAQNWVNLYEDFKPFEEASDIDVTKKMQELGYTAKIMFEMSDDFYKSLGLPSSSMSYGDKALIEKLKNETVVNCHPSAWDFYDGKDFRIKQCTEVNMRDFVVVHHEMGHIMYYILYKDQPLLLRTGATPAFHEAVGDTIALSVSTPKHLETVGLLEEYEGSEADSINSLFRIALDKVAFLPFGLLIDEWRWDVFSKEVQEDQWQKHWWELREKYQKVSRPTEIKPDQFDPGAKYHVAYNSQYISYFLSYILQFQMYKALCIDAEQYDPANPQDKPLHNCDFYQNRKAGERLKKGLSLGASEDPIIALKELTNEEKISASAMLEYFKPLYEYLQKINLEINEEEMNETLIEYDEKASQQCTKLVTAEWNHVTDLENDEKLKEYEQQVLENAKFRKDYFEKYFKGEDPRDYTDDLIKRQIMQVNKLGVDILEEVELKKLTEAKASMTNVYGTAKVCPYKNENCEDKDKLTLDPDLVNILASSEDYEELTYYWKEWRDATGPKMIEDYETYVKLSNDAATANGFKDYGEMWRAAYENPTLELDVKELWKKIQPLYDELHFYVKTQLETMHPEWRKSKDTMPAHILGNMWAQSWGHLYDRTKPFKNVTDVDLTKIIETYEVETLFEMSDTFYKGLGLESNEMSYTGDSIIKKPTDREIQCHASAWDFCDKQDFRIKMCTQKNMEDFVTIHHEMGHIQYYILYKDQPKVLREGANPAFHEAVGDTIALSVSSLKHLLKIGWLENSEEYERYEHQINSLYKMALERVAFLPFGYLIDKWRWDVFSGEIKKEDWNDKWWEYVKEYQKLEPPVDRKGNHFDPGAKYHIPADSQYMAYFLAHILEFQMHQGLCIAAGQYDPKNPEASPLHNCDIDESKEAGEKLRNGLSLGLSKRWSDVLEELTGERDFKSDALLEYFAPLYKFLREQNTIQRQKEMTTTLTKYDQDSSKEYNKVVDATWEFEIDVNSEDKQKAVEKIALENAKFVKQQYEEHFKDIKMEDFEDEDLKRKLTFLKNMGINILNDEDLKVLTEIKLQMQDEYSTAKICPFKKQKCDLSEEGLPLDPKITEIMATSTDYEELKYVWTEWHNKFSSPKTFETSTMRSNYAKYVELSNKAAKDNGLSDYGEMWREKYEDPNFMKTIDNLWEKVRPLYIELHRYVTRKLSLLYKDKIKENDEFLPAHVMGNMWAQSWGHLFERTKPFKNGALIDVTEEMKKQKYSVQRMFETSDKFYTDLGLASNAMSYGSKAMIEKPKDREVVCHASAWDFSDGEDFRIKMCTKINMDDFVTVHHEMGHIQYYIQYKNQPLVYREGANPGFHEAVGDTIALSVSTPKHLEKIGLLKNYKDNHENDINALYKMALEKVAFLPFGLLIDQWRWDVFAGKVQPDSWNKYWWNLREKYQKIKAPSPRSEDDFDPAAKFHVPADSQYIAYFIAHILQFQLHRSLCITAKQYDPKDKNSKLFKCDIDGSIDAGNKFKAGLELGLSKHWSIALEKMTGETEVTADAILEYFEPLYEFLKKENKKPLGEDDGTNQLIPIIIGSVVGGVLVLALVVYLIIHFRNKQKRSED